MIKTIARVSALSLALFGCTESRREDVQMTRGALEGAVQPNLDKSYRVGRNVTEYDSLVPGGCEFAAGADLCEVVHGLNAVAGTYRVERLFGVTEREGDVDTAATYVELALVSDWDAGSPKEVIARIGGGPADDKGTVAQWSIALGRGEIVGLLLAPPMSINKGYYRIHKLGLFKGSSGGGASNGQLFTRTATSLESIADLVKRVRSGGQQSCTTNVSPDVENPVIGSKPPVPTRQPPHQFVLAGGDGMRPAASIADVPTASPTQSSGTTSEQP